MGKNINRKWRVRYYVHGSSFQKHDWIEQFDVCIFSHNTRKIEKFGRKIALWVFKKLTSYKLKVNCLILRNVESILKEILTTQRNWFTRLIHKMDYFKLQQLRSNCDKSFGLLKGTKNQFLYCHLILLGVLNHRILCKNSNNIYVYIEPAEFQLILFRTYKAWVTQNSSKFRANIQRIFASCEHNCLRRF